MNCLSADEAIGPRHPVLDDGLNLVFTIRVLENVRPGIFHAKHRRHAWARNIGIDQADFGAAGSEGHGQVGGYGALAYPPFARGNGDDILHAGQDGVVVAHSGHARRHHDNYLGVFIYHRVHGALAGIVDELLERAGGGSEHHRERHHAAFDLDVFHHVERNQVLPQVGLFHEAQGVAYSFYR
jgi:hypothetical protein